MKSWIEFRQHIDIDTPVTLTRPELYVYLQQIKRLAAEEYGAESGLSIYEALRDELLESPALAREIPKQRGAAVRVSPSKKEAYRNLLEAA